MEKIAVIGGGAAGMMASIFAARRGMEVHVYEKNEKTGKKLYITGKGRCNLTNACDMEERWRVSRATKNSCTVHFMDLPIRMHMIFLKQKG